tara:strand:- start:2177 stop:2356 length:180 start_codon:yes stop_codon:yes gene_type:complete
MEANINNYLFKLDSINGAIVVFMGNEAARPCGYIRVDSDVSEKDFHIEITDWYMNNSDF